MLLLLQVEFEVKSGDVRRANIVCESKEDAIYYVKNLKGFTRINNIGFDSYIHVYTDKAIEYLVKKLYNFFPNNQESSEEKNILTNTNENDTIKYICPYCDKEFEKAPSLKTHMNRAHNLKIVNKEE